MNYEQFMLQEEQLDEVRGTLGGMTNAVLKRGAKRTAGEAKSQTASAGRANAGGVGDAANKVSTAATNTSDAAQITKGTKAVGRQVAKKTAAAAPNKAASIGRATKGLRNVADKASKGIAKMNAPLKAASKTLGGKALGPAAVGVGIADATFNNPEVRKGYHNYSPKDTFGIGPGKTEYKEKKPQQSTFSKELGIDSKTFTDNKNRGRTGAKKRTGK
jgi:hypothetical protein